jgi:hypothetical protein
MGLVLIDARPGDGLEIRHGIALSGPSQCITVASNSFPNRRNWRTSVVPVCSIAGSFWSRPLDRATQRRTGRTNGRLAGLPCHQLIIPLPRRSDDTVRYILIVSIAGSMLRPLLDLPLCHYLHPCQYNDASPRAYIN